MSIPSMSRWKKLGIAFAWFLGVVFIGQIIGGIFGSFLTPIFTSFFGFGGALVTGFISYAIPAIPLFAILRSKFGRKATA